MGQGKRPVTASIRVDSLALARVLSNALAFVPARSSFLGIRLRAATGCVEATGTDTYTAGRDDILGYDHVGAIDGCTVTIGRSEAQGVEKAARADRKGTGTLEMIPGDAAVYTPQEGERIAARDIGDERFSSLWSAVDGLYARAEAAQRLPVPERVAFDPNLFMRFSKVKTVNSQDVADFEFVDLGGNEARALVKIGPTFRGLIMPIRRDATPDGGLWE